MVDGAGGLDEFLGPRRRGTIELAGRVRVRAKQVVHYACHGQPAIPKLRRCQVTRPSARTVAVAARLDQTVRNAHEAVDSFARGAGRRDMVDFDRLDYLARMGMMSAALGPRWIVPVAMPAEALPA
jgi:hypothetical protein